MISGSIHSIDSFVNYIRSLIHKGQSSSSQNVENQILIGRSINEFLNSQNNQRNFRETFLINIFRDEPEIINTIHQNMSLRNNPYFQQNPDLISKEYDVNTILQNLPVSKVTKKKSDGSQDDDCIICLSDFKVGQDIISLPCFHVFHKECIESWLKSKLWCPVCKFKVTLSSLHRES